MPLACFVVGFVCLFLISCLAKNGECTHFTLANLHNDIPDRVCLSGRTVFPAFAVWLNSAHAQAEYGPSHSIVVKWAGFGLQPLSHDALL